MEYVLVLCRFQSSQPSVCLLHPVILLALPERFVESLAQADVGLLLCALDEIFHLPRACAALFGLLLSVGLLGGVGLLLLWGRGSGFLATTSTTEHSCEGVSSHVANG